METTETTEFTRCGWAVFTHKGATQFAANEMGKAVVFAADMADAIEGGWGGADGFVAGPFEVVDGPGLAEILGVSEDEVAAEIERIDPWED